MKKFKIKLVGILLIMVFLTGACDKWIDPEINTDPNNPSDATLELLLPSSQGGLAYVSCEFSRYTSQWMQQICGVGRQSLIMTRYTFTQTDPNNGWRWGLYAGALMDLNTMKIKAEEESSPHYGGVAKILMAYGLGFTTDLFGDIPYSKAFQGSDELQPAYDKQEDIYTAIFSLLDGAITDLQEAASVTAPGSNDLIYGGDLTLWLKAAYSLKARYKLHLSGINSASAYTDALTALANGFTSNADDFEFVFGSTASSANGQFQFFEQREGDIASAAYLVDAMNATNDPRLPMLVSPNDSGDYLGNVAGDVGSNISLVENLYYTSISSPKPFMTYVEVKFIEAEALFEGGKTTEAATAHNDAIIASLAKLGVSDPTWEAANAAETSGTITLEKIITAKHLALFLDLEAYNDWRRTGFPTLTPAINNTTSGVIPTRFPYPADEYTYNGANVPKTGVSITDRVWWDIN